MTLSINKWRSSCCVAEETPRRLAPPVVFGLVFVASIAATCTLGLLSSLPAARTWPCGLRSGW
eukprot:350564-Chlamydomonas_euryale.AAC.4